MNIVRYRLLGFSPKDMTFIKQTLDDPRGHAGNSYCFRRCRKPHAPDVIMRLTPRDMIDELFGNNTELANLSVTDFSGHPKKVYIDHINWRTIPEGFTGCHKTYKQYIIQHEMGHAIGILEHSHPIYDQTHKGKCPVMYQQTRGTPMCEANPWVYPDKKGSSKKSKKSKKRAKKKKRTKKKTS